MLFDNNAPITTITAITATIKPLIKKTNEYFLCI